jgi:hypothetical protein
MNDRYAIERLVAPLIEKQAKLEREVERLRTRTVGPLATGARVTNTAALSIANNTTTALTFNTERHDTHGFHSTSVNTGRLTIPGAGRYLVVGQAIFASNATGYRNAVIRLNGTTIIAQHLIGANATDATGLIVSTVWSFSAADYVELAVSQTSGGSLDVSVFAERSPEFIIERVA